MLSILALSAAVAPGQEDVRSRIAGAAMTRGGASAFLETLTDRVGGRVTGTPQSRAAAELILEALKTAGYANARFEEFPLESRWTRGPATGRIVSPIERPIAVGSYSWVPGTAGEIMALVVDAGSPASRDWTPPAAVRGAAVLVDPRKVGDDPGFVMRHVIAGRLAAAGAAAMLIPSDKPDRMVYTSAFGFYPKGPLPIVSVAREDALLLRRLLAKGRVRLGLNVRNTFDTSPYRERNVIADLQGTSPDEVVLLGAHLDSWDPAEGAQDDGSGVAAVLEAARILRSLGVTPRRTIRFAFFSGEEEGCLGSRAYVAAHGTELDRLRAVLVMDSGAQTPKGLELHGRADLEPAVRKLLEPLAPFGADGVTAEATFDRDHAPFMVAGVPAFTLWVEPGDYDVHHHAISDTFDKVDPRLLALDTAVMAIAGWELANAPSPIGRRLPPAEAEELLRTSGVASTRRMVYGDSEGGAPRLRAAGEAALFQPGLVSTEASEVRIAFSPDGRRMLWGTIGRAGGPGGWEIFESVRTGDSWGAPKAPPFNSSANDFDPSFAPGGSGVYFFSNREGGLGGDDLYFAPLDPKLGEWGAAVNLGPGVNTPRDEWAPAVSPDGARLLFATDGRGGKGKHDLFVATRVNGRWDRAENLEPLNTPDEDFDATFLDDGRSVILSSGDLEGAVTLFLVPFSAGRYGVRQPLGPEINSAVPEAWTFGPSIAASEPGVLYVTSRRKVHAGRADIYRVEYRLER